MSAPRRRWPWLVLGAAGLASMALGAMSATAQGGEVVLGLNAVAASDGVGWTFGDPGAQPYPLGAGQVAHTQAALSTGPTGYALASTAWPGPLAGNAGSLAVLLGGPPEAGNANYSARAEAFSPAGPNDDTKPGMRAHAEGNEAEAIANAEDVQTQPGATTGDVSTRSFSSIDAGTLQSVSSCTASDVGFADGVVQIGSVRTESQSSTDGTSGASGGRTVVSGMTVGGQNAEVDEDGVRFTDPATAPVGEQILANFGIDMFVAAPRSTQGSNTASYHAGPLVVIWEPPGSGYVFIYTICGSDSSVALRTGAGFSPVVETGGGPPEAPQLVLDVGASAPPPSSWSAPLATPTPTAGPSAPTIAGVPVGFVRDLAIWPYVVGLVSIVAAGIGLGRAREVALTPRITDVACPLEGANP